MNRPPNTAAESQALPERMKQAIAELTAASKDLQQAIIKKDLPVIWKILSLQQEKLTEFEQCNYLWRQIASDEKLKTESMIKAKDEINAEMKILKIKNKSNITLITSFLSAIRKAMRKSEQITHGHNPVYGSKGKLKLKGASLIVNSVG